jgi:hypothetical protein
MSEIDPIVRKKSLSCSTTVVGLTKVINFGATKVIKVGNPGPEKLLSSRYIYSSSDWDSHTFSIRPLRVLSSTANTDKRDNSIKDVGSVPVNRLLDRYLQQS